QPATLRRSLCPPPVSPLNTTTPPDTSTLSLHDALPIYEGFWGKVNPFARKKYVQRQTAPIRDRVNELDELTSQNTKLIKDVDSRDRKSTRLNSSHVSISYAVFCLKKKKEMKRDRTGYRR